jgi:hypothetical protein
MIFPKRFSLALEAFVQKQGSDGDKSSVVIHVLDELKGGQSFFVSFQGTLGHKGKMSCGHVDL